MFGHKEAVEWNNATPFFFTTIWNARENPETPRFSISRKSQNAGKISVPYIDIEDIQPASNWLYLAKINYPWRDRSDVPRIEPRSGQGSPLVYLYSTIILSLNIGSTNNKLFLYLQKLEKLTRL